VGVEFLLLTTFRLWRFIVIFLLSSIDYKSMNFNSLVKLPVSWADRRKPYVEACGPLGGES
jgi:hypothetical protein